MIIIASLKQINYITGLAKKRDLTNVDPDVLAWINDPGALEIANNKNVDWLLTELKKQPNKPPDPVLGPYPNQRHDDDPLPLPASERLAKLRALEARVSKGRYFIIDPYDGQEKFIRVKKPEAPSRWVGYTFVETQASDYFYPVKNEEHRTVILEQILENPTEAMNQYGIKLGVCGYCGRTLTNRDSRLRGIGPICADVILGTTTPEQLDLLHNLKERGVIKSHGN